MSLDRSDYALADSFIRPVCHSDYSLLTFENQPGWFQEKFTLVRKISGFATSLQLTSNVAKGHEGCGQIIQIGVAVANSKLKIVSRKSDAITPRIN